MNIRLSAAQTLQTLFCLPLSILVVRAFFVLAEQEGVGKAPPLRPKGTVDTKHLFQHFEPDLRDIGIKRLKFRLVPEVPWLNLQVHKRIFSFISFIVEERVKPMLDITPPPGVTYP